MPTATAISTPTRTSIEYPTSIGTNIEILDASVLADWVLVGHSTTVQLTVATSGQRSERTFRVTHGGTEVSTRTMTVPANSTAKIEFEVTFEEPGTGIVEVDGVRAGGLTVATTSEETPMPADQVDKADRFTIVPGFIAFVVSTIWVGSSIRRRGR